MPNNNTIPSWDETVEVKQSVPSFEDTTPIETVKKKEEPVSFVGSESLGLPSAPTVDKQPLTYMQQELRDKDLVTDNVVPKTLDELKIKKNIGFYKNATDAIPSYQDQFKDQLNKEAISLEQSHAKIVDAENKINETVAMTGRTPEEVKDLVHFDAFTKSLNPRKTAPQESYAAAPIRGLYESVGGTLQTIGGAIDKFSETLGFNPPTNGSFTALGTFFKDQAKNLKATPDDAVGDMAQNIGAIVGDVGASALMPEIALPNLSIGGVVIAKQIPKFPLFLGAKNGTQAYVESDNPLEPTKKGAEGFVEGLKYEMLGIPARKIGDLVSKAATSELLGEGAAALASGLTFGTDASLEEYANTGNLKSRTFLSNLGIGAGFHMGKIKTEILSGMQNKAESSFFNASPEQIRQSIDAPKTKEELRKQAITFRQEAFKTDGEERNQYLLAATMADRTADIKAVADDISLDKDKYLEGIKRDNTLTPERKNEAVNLVNDTHEYKSVKPEEKEVEKPIIEETKPTAEPIVVFKAKVEPTKQEPIVVEENKRYLDEYSIVEQNLKELVAESKKDDPERSVRFEQKLDMLKNDEPSFWQDRIDSAQESLDFNKTKGDGSLVDSYKEDIKKYSEYKKIAESKIALKSTEIKPNEPISATAEPQLTEEAPIVPVEEKEGLKQQKDVVVESNSEYDKIDSELYNNWRDLNGKLSRLDKNDPKYAVVENELDAADKSLTDFRNNNKDLILEHGTAHDFESFDIEKIGTGEGVQAFGHGLYFTEETKIAKGYARKLSEDKLGIVYKVAIKDGRNKEWIEWRDALSDTQEQKISNAAAEYKDAYDKYLNEAEEKSHTGAAERIFNEGLQVDERPLQAGAVYLDLRDAFGAKKATEIMVKSGIDGVVYNSVGGKGKAKNYVVFNPESITIKEKTIQQQKQPTVVGEQIEVKQSKLKENGKETSKKADGQGRKEKLLEKSKQADDLLSEGLSDIADLLGTKLSLTGEQRVKVKDAVRKVAKGIILKGEVKAEQLAIAVKEYFSKAGHDISDELINETLKEEGYASEIRKGDQENIGTQKGVVEGTEGQIPVRNASQDQKAARGEDGESLRQQGVKIVESTTLPEDIKADFKKQGIDYLPRGRKVTREEANQIAQAKLQMDGGREQLKKDILDPTNNIKGDTRIALAVEFVKDAKDNLLKAKTQSEIDKARADITDVLTYTMNRSTDVAQELEANKMITELLGSDPEFIEDVYRRDVQNKNESFYEAEKENIKTAQQIISDYLNSEEFKQKYKVKPPTQEGKLTTKQLHDRGINKIANATSKLADLIGAKKSFIPEEMGKGTDLFDALKELGDGLLDVGVASTKELMDKIKAETRKFFKSSEIDAISKQLIEELKAEERVKGKKQRVIALDSKDEKALVDRLYSKVINANEKQLKQLLADNVDLLAREGSINDEAFKELFAKAMGKGFVDQKEIDKLKSSAQLVQDLKKVESELDALFNHAIVAEANGVPKEEVEAIKKQIRLKLKEHTTAIHEAEKAAKIIGETFAGKSGLAEKIGAVIKGNLITPASQVVNIIGNYSMVPVRSSKNVVATSLDILLSGVGELSKKLIAKVNEKEIAYINKEAARLGIPKDKVNVPISFARTKRALAKLPEPRRVRTGFGLSKQRFIGEGKGYVQGIKQLWTGALPTDLQRVELRSGLHPLDALLNNYRMLSGKEKMDFKDFANNTYEATVGVAPEVTFRLLNLFDKPVRMGAERDKLNQLADLKGLKGSERDKFIEMPDLESAEIARKAGDEATFQQDTWLSKWSSKLDQKMLKGAKESTNIMTKAAYYTGYYAKNMVVPFVKTPINVEMELLGYAVPELAVARGLFAMYHGDRQAFTENMGKAIVGSYMLKGISYLFGAGIMTLASGGHEDNDSDEFIAPKIKAAEYRDKPAYYINIDAWQRDIHNKVYGTNLSLDWQEGDQISSYRRMGIVSAMAMAQAEAFRGKTKEEIRNLSFWQTANTSIPALAKSGAEQTFVSGTSSLINVFIGTDYERDNFFLGLSKAAGASVLPNAVKTYMMANDNYIRETKDATKKGVDAIKSKIITDFKASLTKGSDIPTKITIWGERVNRYEDGASPAFELFDITKTKTYKSDFGAKIFELYEKISADEEKKKEMPPKSILPPVLSNKIKYKEEEVALDPKTFEDMQIYVGTNLKEKTWSMLSSMDWDNASDERKFKKLKMLYNSDDSYRNKLIKRYVSSHKDVLDSLWLDQFGAK